MSLAHLFSADCIVELVLGSARAEEVHADERALAAGYGPEPAALFALGRTAAHRCLRHYGLESQPVLRGAGGEPIFPGGLKGSIAHTEGAGIAVTGPGGIIGGIGIDVERRGRQVNPDIARKVCRGPEAANLERAGENADELLLAFFCAKEAAYKAFFSYSGVRLRFEDVELDPGPEGFRGRLAEPERWPGLPKSFRALTWRGEGLLVLGVTLPS